jgi:hypothetical protein
MSSLIMKQPKDTRKQTTVSLSGTVLADLELYCRFIESGRDWVINEALRSVFRRDKAFLEWKEKSTSSPATSGGSVEIAAAHGGEMESVSPLVQSPLRRPRAARPIEGPGTAI